MAGGAETPNIAALPAIARLGTCESARGPDADRHVKLLIQFAVEGSLSGAYSHSVADVRPEALAWTKAVMTRLGLTLNEARTSLKNARQERFDFLG